MDPEQFEEWQRLEEQAHNLIRQGSVKDRRGASRLFQILVLPAFDDAASWEVFKSRSSPVACFAICNAWRRQLDADKLATPVVRLRYPRVLYPTIDVRQYEITEDWTESAVSALRRLTIPAMVEQESIGTDGVFYGVSFDYGFVKASYEWWFDPPPGWRELNTWLKQTLSELEHITASGP